MVLFETYQLCPKCSGYLYMGKCFKCGWSKENKEIKKFISATRNKGKNRSWIKARKLFLRKKEELRIKEKIKKREEKKKSKQAYLNDFI